MKKYNVQPRIYDGGKKYENYVDRYSVFYPLPKKYREDPYEDRGIYLGCSVMSNGGLNRCTWEPVECHDRIGISLNWGKRVKLESFPKPFQKAINRFTRIYNRALNENTDKAWGAWNQC